MNFITKFRNLFEKLNFRNKMQKTKDHQIFNKQFVQIIRQYPNVYNNTDAETLNSSDIDKVWQNIAEQVEQQFGTETSAYDCRLRWTSLLRSFLRYKHRRITTKPYYLYDDMKFLDPFIREPRRRGIRTKEEDETSEALRPNSSISSQAMQYQQSRPNSPISQNFETHLNESPKRKRKKGKLSAFEERILSYLEKSNKKDADLEFFESILPDISEFTPYQKRKLKRGLLQLIDDISEESRI